MSEELRFKLKAARAKLGLSQSQASTEWEIPLPTIKAWENNQRTPRGLALRTINTMLDGILNAPKPAKPKPTRKPRR